MILQQNMLDLLKGIMYNDKKSILGGEHNEKGFKQKYGHSSFS